MKKVLLLSLLILLVLLLGACAPGVLPPIEPPTRPLRPRLRSARRRRSSPRARCDPGDRTTWTRDHRARRTGPGRHRMDHELA